MEACLVEENAKRFRLNRHGRSERGRIRVS